MLEKMGDFFDSRLSEYEEHQLNCIDYAKEFYPLTAKHLPQNFKAHVLDLGCGTGLELEEYFALNPYAKVTGIDLAPGMLKALKNKFLDKDITLINGSYFDVPLGTEIYDAAVSVESLHHFTKEEKVSLYTKLFRSLKINGYFILTDYFALSDVEEENYRKELSELKMRQGIVDDGIYHFDTPLTAEHEKEALHSGGFSSVEVIGKWKATYMLKASK